jgi:Ser/Thr protein kinase RdoA (MazF antagonist)
MDSVFPVMYSMLSGDALGKLIEETFDIGSVVKCQILSRGLNDTYIVATANNQYVLRVYRTPWRSHSDVKYEVDVLEYLAQHGVSVSSPIRNRDGELANAVTAPEGVRQVALFTYADGTRGRLDPNVSHEYGRTLAQMHNVTDGFSPACSRPPLDRRHLIDEPVGIFTPAMVEYGGDVAYVHAWARTLRDCIAVEGLDFGFCHGDFHDWNAHWNGSMLTIFDFDCCGPGYRMYDLAVFLWNLKINYKGCEAENWAPFLDGYRTVRPLADRELQAIPWFVPARRIWLAGLYLSNEDVWPTHVVNKAFFRSFVDQLKEDEKALNIKIS